GAIRLFSRADSEKEGEDTFWLNEHAPLFLHADPPAEKGIARFKAEFKVDRNKMLLITVYDLSSGLRLLEDYPVIRLN
ncbi:MAG TPA: Hsp70 family protein, partial [Flexilinea sp.]|nr:Hsp70 family protein [Flexilinea sp.]